MPSDRYFSSTAMAGRLHFNDIGDHAWWDPSRILFTNERDLDAILPRMVAVKIHTVDELDKALMASENHPGSKSLYVYETLLETAKRRWEELRNQLSFT